MTVGFLEVWDLVALFDVTHRRGDERYLAKTLANAFSSFLSEAIVVNAFLLGGHLLGGVGATTRAFGLEDEATQEAGQFGGL